MKREITLFALGIAALYVISRGARERIDELINPVTKTFADAWVRLTAGPPVSVTDGAVLPDGSRVLFDEIVAAGSYVNSNYEFSWRGAAYRLTDRRSDGWYNAVAVHA